MSKVSEAKKAQEYTPKHQPGVCGRCKYMTFEVQLPDWMEEKNKANPGRYTVAEYGIEKNRRCAVGGFTVKKMGSCNTFEVSA